MSPTNGGNDMTDSDCGKSATSDTESQCVTLTPVMPENLNLDCGYFSECDLTLDKKCIVPMPPALAGECPNEIDELQMRWLGSDADPPMPNTVAVAAWKGAVGNDLLLIDMQVDKGDTVIVPGYDGSPNDVTWEIYEYGATCDAKGCTGILIGDSTFHLSCSDSEMKLPEHCGTPQGDGKRNDDPDLINAWELVNLIGLNGQMLCEAPEVPVAQDMCEIRPSDLECEKRPTEISFRYTGEDCAASSHMQDPDKTDCDGDPAFADPVYIIVDHDGQGGDVAFEGFVDLDEVYAATAAMAGRDDFHSESFIRVFDDDPADPNAFASLLQEMRFHTSCSQPLSIGDAFGSAEVVGFVNAEQGNVSAGTDVIYTFMVTNNGSPGDVCVTDTTLGLNFGPVFLANGESHTFTTEPPVSCR